MASTVNEIGNGIGYLYESLQDNTITASRKNTVEGVRDMLSSSCINAPLGAGRSAIATITIDDVASVGAWSAVNINGQNQIGGLINVTTANEIFEATVLAAAINAFTPGIGPDYTAFSIGAVVYIVEPQKSAGSVNGVLPVVAVTDVSIQTTVTAFAGGAAAAGSYDPQFGRLYWLDATSGATPDSIAGALDVTKYMTLRPISTNMPDFTLTLSSDQVTFIDRYAQLITVNLLNEGAAGRDNVEFINPEGFIKDDIIFVQQSDSAQSQDVISTPNATLTNANIYLTNDAAFASDNFAILTLKYIYDDILGGIWREVGRSTPATIVVIDHGKTLYVDAIEGDDTLAARQEFYPNVFQTPDAAFTAALAGDTIVFRKNTYAVTLQILSKVGITIDLTSGATLTGTNFLGNIAAGSRITGGNVFCTGTLAAAPGAYSAINVEVFEIGIIDFSAANNFTINCSVRFSCHGYMNVISTNNTYIKFTRGEFDNSLGIPGAYCIGLSVSASNSVPVVEGDVYITAGTFDSFVRCVNSASLTYNPRYKGRIFVSAGVIMGYMIRSYSSQNGSIMSPNRFIVEGEIHCPVAPSIAGIHALGGGEIEFIGKMYLTNQGSKPAVISDTEAAARNKTSKVFLTDCDIYSDTTGDLMLINDIGFTTERSTIVGKNLSTIALYATTGIQGDVAGCKYQSKGWWTNVNKGGNVANALGTTDIQFDALMI